MEKSILPDNGSEKVGLYVRISEQDRIKLTRVQLSKSIENQLAMLNSECKDRGWVVVDTYCDEDISGADQTRPEFNRLIRDCEKGKINTVLCKSQDRFARDMEMIEKYIHNKFIEWGVRFVTIVDHADTNIKENKKNRQITGLTNEWYLEDLSNNIKTTFNAKRKNGDYVGSFAPYGYEKERDLKNVLHLVIDPVAAEVVRRIFKEYANGKACRAIARDLNKDNILCPSEYKWENGKYINMPKKIYSCDTFIKTGGYVIKSDYFNENLKVDTVIKQISKFHISDDDFKNDCKVYLFKTNSKSVYYTDKQIEESEVLKYTSDTRLWKKININDEIPLSATYIYTKYVVSKRYEDLFTSFWLNIEVNRNRRTIRYENYGFIDGKRDDYFTVGSRHKSIWGKQSIRNILTNPVYIGTLVQGKSTTVSYKNHTTIWLPKERWKVVKNAHDPIIDMKTWLQVSKRREKMLRGSKSQKVNIFSGVLKCSYCGRSFVSTKCGRSGDRGQKSYYVCGDKSTKFSNCINSIQLRQDELELMAIREINKLIREYKDENKLKELIDNLSSDKHEFNTKTESLNIEKNNLLKNKSKNSRYLMELYENKVNGLIDTDEYFTFKANYKEENEKIEKRIQIIENEIELINIKRNELKTKDSIIKKYDKIEKLSYEIVHEFLSEVKVGLKKENGERTIEFLWNF